jgi:hypothetical protein
MMALWPFRRKSGRKRARSGGALDIEGGLDRVPRSLTANDVDPTLARHEAPKKRRTESGRLQRRERTHSFSPGRDDVLGVERNKWRSGDSGKGKEPARRRSRRSKEQLDDEERWERAPTLHKQNVLRKRSSKRRREDHDREEEIRAMAAFMPVRAATDIGPAGRPMKKQSKRVKTTIVGFGRFENPESDISIPTVESFQSSMSSDSDYGSYKIGVLDSLAPRPTLRYTVYPRWGPAATSAPTRTPSQRRRLADMAPFTEATLKANKRVDELADDLDASDLRELMDRDKRRRDRKQQRDQERAERRIARKAEKQRAAEEEAARDGTPPLPNLDRGVLGREVVGLGIDTTSAVVTSSRRRPSDASPRQEEKLPEKAAVDEAEPHPRPLDKFHRTTSIPVEQPPTPMEAKKARAAHATDLEVLDSVEDLAPSSHSPKHHLGMLRSRKSRSKQSLDATQSRSTISPPPPAAKLEQLESQPRKSDGSSRGRLSLSSLFKWGSKRRRTSGSGGPTSFSNTSREEMHAAVQTQIQAPPAEPASNKTSTTTAPPTAPTPTASRKVSGGIPKRTRSRFREDLPELPISPPDSRPDSPEVEVALEPLVEQNTHDQSSPAIPSRFDTPTSGHRSIDDGQKTPTSPLPFNASPEPPQSISLASIDSEASWLSGRLTGRRSAGLRSHHSHHSHHSYHSHPKDHSPDAGNSSADDEHAIVQDEYLARLTPSGRHHQSYGNPRNRQSTGEARPSSDGDEPMETPVEGNLRWGSVSARHDAPTMVHAEEDRSMAKSREGLLKSCGEADQGGDSEGDDLVEEDLAKEGGLQRATSINLGKGHARHISAGSAKLLEISPRESMDSRRRSSSAVFL